LGDPGAGGQEAVGSTKLLIEARPAACYPFEVISMNPEIKSKKLYRSRTDSELAGVCGGLAQYFKIDSSLVRLAFAVVTIAGGGSGFLLYLLAWGIVPRQNNLELEPSAEVSEVDTHSAEL
jgi:phage shock protein PspC (stress-responsive transcriptional regulator)